MYGGCWVKEYSSLGRKHITASQGWGYRSKCYGGDEWIDENLTIAFEMGYMKNHTV